MSNNNDNQQEPKVIIHLYEIQPELISALATVKKIFKRLSIDSALAYLIYHELGDNQVTALKHFHQVISYLQVITENNQMTLDAFAKDEF